MRPVQSTLSENIRAQSVGPSELFRQVFAEDEHQLVFAVSGTLASFGQSVREATGRVTAFADANTADLLPKPRAASISNSGSSNLTLLRNE
jgi:hypothetical protein